MVYNMLKIIGQDMAPSTTQISFMRKLQRKYPFHYCNFKFTHSRCHLIGSVLKRSQSLSAKIVPIARVARDKTGFTIVWIIKHRTYVRIKIFILIKIEPNSIIQSLRFEPKNWPAGPVVHPLFF